jgi:branched-chain amino acid aminotransferase
MNAIDWSTLGFEYTATPARFQATWSGGHFDMDALRWTGGEWTDGQLIEDAQVHIEEGACALHYGQQCFEGLKAFSARDGSIRVFRPAHNAARMAGSARRLLMPEVPAELFLAGVESCLRANRESMPPHGTGAAMYVRPLLIGVGDNLGLKPAKRYIFRVFCSPVGPYFKGGFAAVRLKVTDIDRAAPRGTGAYKVGGNYAGGLLASFQAKRDGYNEALYLDASERQYLEEAGSANIFGVLPPLEPGGPARFVTPRSESILPSITMASVLTLAEEELGLQVARRKVSIDEVEDFVEMGCTGTAAVITPVGLVHHQGRDIHISDEPGPITRDLYKRLTDIQYGDSVDERGWVQVLKNDEA